jgi:hypothetical protein
MKGVRINFAVDSYRPNTELFRSANDTTRDFPSERQFEHVAKLDFSFSTYLFAMSILSKWGFRAGNCGGSGHASYRYHRYPIKKLWIRT